MWKVRRRWLPHREGVGVRARFRRVTRRKDRRRQSPPPEGTAVTRVDPKKVPERSKDKNRWYDSMDVTGGCLDSVDEMWVLAVAVIVFMLLFFVVPPVVLIGVDLLWMGVVFLIGAVGRFALGRPWTVEAVGPDDERRAWQVKGFRGAGQLRDALQTEFDVGLDPKPNRLGQ